MKQAVLLVGHGSKLKGSDEAIKRVAEALNRIEPETFVQTAFLDIQSPDIQEGIQICLHQGADEVIVIPYFVQTGRHVVKDIPDLVSQAKSRFPSKRILLGGYLGFDERMVSIVREKVNQARKG